MPTPTLEEDDEEETADADEEEQDTMPDDDTENEEEESEETESEAGGSGDGEEEPEVTDDEVAEAEMPEDAEEADADDEAGGILGSINTKAIVIVAGAVAIGAIVLWFIRNRSFTGQTVRDTEADRDSLEGEDVPEEGEYDITAPDDRPLEQDQQMMDKLGMGS